MFISKLRYPERKENNSLTSRVQIQNSRNPWTVLRNGVQEAVRVPFLFLIFLTDINKKYRNEIEMDKRWQCELYGVCLFPN